MVKSYHNLSLLLKMNPCHTYLCPNTDCTYRIPYDQIELEYGYKCGYLCNSCADKFIHLMKDYKFDTLYELVYELGKFTGLPRRDPIDPRKFLDNCLKLWDTDYLLLEEIAELSRCGENVQAEQKAEEKAEEKAEQKKTNILSSKWNNYQI